jgi:Tol biopolymer transport system component
LLNLPQGEIPSADVLDWGPTPARANQLLYASYLNSGIYQVSEGSDNTGTELIDTGIDQVIDVQWLPDGSGFLFTQAGDFRTNANIFHYDLASTTVTPLTTFTNEFAIDLSPSPDGQSIVFERSATLDLTSGDLWIMQRDGTNLRLLVENGLRPSWSLQAPQLPTPTATPDPQATTTPAPTPTGQSAVYLPTVRR